MLTLALKTINYASHSFVIKTKLGMEFYKFIGIFALDIEESKKQNKMYLAQKRVENIKL